MTLPVVGLRPMARADLTTLARWLADPLVARWWAEDPADAETRYGRELDEGLTEFLVVTVDGRDAGLVQRYPIAAYPEFVTELAAAGIEVPTGAWSIDYLLGDERVRGRGVGTAMTALAVSGIWSDDPVATCVIVPVHEKDVGSWKALLAAGFQRLGDADLDPDNPADSRRHVLCRIDQPG